jgi:hypothetical protein
MSPPIQRQRVDLLLAGEALGFPVFAEQADSMDDGLILLQVQGHGAWLAAPKPTEEGTQPDGGEGGGMGHGARGDQRMPPVSP